MLQDLRYALLMILQQPWFSAAIIGTLALGIGVNTTVFAFVNAVLFKPLAFPGSDRIVMAPAFSRGVQNIGKPYWIRFEIDYVVLAYFAALSVFAGILFGLVLAIQATRVVFQFTLAVILLSAAAKSALDSPSERAAAPSSAWCSIAACRRLVSAWLSASRRRISSAASWPDCSWKCPPNTFLRPPRSAKRFAS